MKKTITITKRLFLMFLIFGAFLLAYTPTHAASFTKAKPKINKYSTYSNKYICLKWKKIKGAKRYEIQRAKINPKKDNSVGKWKKWTTTKKTQIKKKGAGDYKYRVRAIKGSKKSKWSAAKRIFGASGRITDVIYEKPHYVLGFYIEGKLNFRVLINNKTQSQMGFVKTSSQSTIYALDKNTGKTIKSWPGYLYIAESNGYAKTISPKKEQSVYFYCRMDEEEYAQYQNCKFMVTATFYPNPYTESITRAMAIGVTTNVKESALPCK